MTKENDAWSEPHRLHRWSILFGILKVIRQSILTLVAAIFFASSGNKYIAMIASASIVLALIAAAFNYFTTRYRIDDGEFIFDQGLIFKRHRTIPIDNIQNIDLLQTPIHKSFGVAEVRIETASGGQAEAVLRVLALDEYQQLRRQVFQADEHSLEANATSKPVDSDSIEGLSNSDFPDTQQPRSGLNQQTSEPTRDHILSISPSLLATHGVVSTRGFVLVSALMGVYYQFDFDSRFDVKRMIREVKAMIPVAPSNQSLALIGLGLVVLVAIGSAAWFVIRFYPYELSRRGNDLRVDCGWLTRVSATIPRDRIQFISVHRSWWARLCGNSVIRIETAGGTEKTQKAGDAVLARKWFVPVAKKAQVSIVLDHLRSGLGNWENAAWVGPAPGAEKRLRKKAVLFSIALTLVCFLFAQTPWSLLTLIVFLPLFLWYSKRYKESMRIAVDETRVCFRDGVIVQRQSACDFDKIQSVKVSSSPFDRRWSMATLTVDSAAAGPAGHKIQMKYLNHELALRYAEQISSASTSTGYSG